MGEGSEIGSSFIVRIVEGIDEVQRSLKWICSLRHSKWLGKYSARKLGFVCSLSSFIYTPHALCSRLVSLAACSKSLLFLY